MVSQSVVVCVALLATVAVAGATEVQQCPGRSADASTNSSVQLTPCKKLPCKLKKGTNQHISINFTPEKDLTEVKNHVTAHVVVDVPFIGVDGNSICENIYTESGEKAPCPLKAGTTYTYKDSFPVLAFYPSITTTVHWALQDEDKRDLVCFEVPVRIA